MNAEGIEAGSVAFVEKGIAAQVSGVAKGIDQRIAAFGSSYRGGGRGGVMDCFCFIEQAVSGFFYCCDRDAKCVFAVQELQEDHDAFGAVVGEEDSL